MTGPVRNHPFGAPADFGMEDDSRDAPTSEWGLGAEGA